MKAQRHITYRVDESLLVTEHKDKSVSLHDLGCGDDSFRIEFSPGNQRIMTSLEELCEAYRRSLPEEETIEKIAIERISFFVSLVDIENQIRRAAQENMALSDLIRQTCPHDFSFNTWSQWVHRVLATLVDSGAIALEEIDGGKDEIIKRVEG